MKASLFCYSIPATLVPANNEVEPSINFNNETDFDICEIRSTPHAINAILMQLSMASGELLSNVPVDTSQFSGTSLAVRLPVPVRIPANAQLNVRLINTTAGNLTSQVQFWGYKVPRGV